MSYVYRHFDKNHNLLYVGMSLNAVSRLQQHKQHAHWFDQITHIEIEKFKSRKDAFVAERQAIHDENPMHNISRPLTDAEIAIKSKHSFDNKDDQVIISHKLFNSDIAKHVGTGFLSATDLVKAGNICRIMDGMPMFDMPGWFNQKSNKDFLSSMESKFGVVKISGSGRGRHTWVHPFLFTEIARSLGSKLKIEFHEWLELSIEEIKI